MDCNPVPKFDDHYLCSVIVSERLGYRDAIGKRVELVLFKDGDAWRVQ